MKYAENILTILVNLKGNTFSYQTSVLLTGILPKMERKYFDKSHFGSRDKH